MKFQKFHTIISSNSLKSQKVSIQENNGHNVLMKLEINKDVVHVGLLVLLKLSVIDYVLPQTVKLILYYHHNTQLLVIQTITDVKVVILTKPGNSSKELVSHLMHVSHTPLVLVEKDNAQKNVLMELHLNYTKLRLPLATILLKMLRLIFLLMVQLKLVSKFMKISWVIKLVFTDILVVVSSVDMLSRLLVGVLKKVLNIGLPPIHGEPNGETMVSSESKKVNATLRVN